MLPGRASGRRSVWRSAAAWAIGLALTGWAVVSAGRLEAAPAIPGPLGGPEISIDVNTMLRKKGPAFTLRDGDGRVYHVAPGSTGKPLVIISHMGFY
jgi:hypothetical protein